MPIENFHLRKNTNKQRRGFIDGMSGMTAGGLERSGQVDFRPVSGQRLRPGIDDFRRVEGYRPARRTPGFDGNSRLRRPLQPASGRIVRMDGLTPAPKRSWRKPGWRKVMSKSALSMIAVTLILGGLVAGKGYLKARQIFKGGSAGAAALQENVDPSRLNGEGDGRVNILLMGKGGMGHDGADLTDTLIIASIDPLQKEASLLSIPRDLYVKVPDLGSMKINSVYAVAKEQLLTGNDSAEQIQKVEKEAIATTQKVLETSMGIPIHYYTLVDFEAFRKAIDTVGGVNINVQEQLYDPTVAWENNNNPLIAATGPQNFDGKKALLYARSRHGSARGDFDRSSRQREIILGLKDKVLSAGTFSNPLKISQLFDDFGDHVQTNLGLNELNRLYALTKDIDSSKVASIGLSDPPNNYVTIDNVGGLSVVVPSAGVYNFKEIQHFVRNSLKDGFIRDENANVIVLNGTGTPGLATRAAEELRSFGYNVTLVGDAPTDNYRTTTLINLRGDSKKYTQRYLEQRLGVKAVGNLPDAAIQPGTSDFVVILGQE